jgi:hypothetical protein
MHAEPVKLGIALVLVGCSPAAREVPASNPDAPIPDASDVEAAHPVTAVLVRDDGVMWSYGSEACSLEFGCWYGGPAVSYWEAKTNATWIHYDDSPAGAMTVVGSGKEAFIITGVTHEERYVKRLDNTTALSLPRPWTRGPAVDDTYVYWAESSVAFGPHVIRRALRNGDGSDAATIVADAGVVRSVAVVAGYVWWIAISSGLQRAPVSGGVPEPIRTNANKLTTSTDGLVVELLGNGQHELGVVDGAGSYRALAPLTTELWFLVADDQNVYWSTATANSSFAIHKTALAGGPVELTVGDMLDDVFAVTPTQYLVDFSTAGFRRIDR